MTRLLVLAALCLLASCASAPRVLAPAEVERFEIVQRSSAFDGIAFEGVGEYEVVTAIAHMRINASHVANRGIVGLDQASAPDGWVHYKADVIILRPVDAGKASHVLLADLPNRGRKLGMRAINEGEPALELANSAGNGFAMRRGHTLAWIGWQGDVPLSGDGKTAGAALPVVAGTGPGMEETVFDDIAASSAIKLSYPAASLEQARAVLTVQATSAAAPAVLPPASWQFKGAGEIVIARPANMDAGAIYRFRYEAREPRVMGLGLAALRDVTSYLKSRAGPLEDLHLDMALAFGVSLSGRMLRDFLWQGFNADARGAKVFDGVMPVVAGAGRSFVNTRFARPGKAGSPDAAFPFSYGVTSDPVSGKRDGILAACTATATCPKVMHIDSSEEFWQGRASLITTDGAGKDIALPAGVRAYLMASTQHLYASTPTVGICKYQNNPATQAPLLRALIDDMVAWVREGREPPASRFPHLADTTMTPPQREAQGFPDLRAIGVGYPEAINGLPGYQLLVPMEDEDGHDVAGVRLPDIAVPLATHAGWNLRRMGFAENQLCDLNGLFVPFAPTPRAGDPRRAISQRYKNRLDYAKAVAVAARELRDQGLLLEEDVESYIERARSDPRVKP
ncbi:MAG: alpha/beta hydrolase domain-containing protein [Pseudomonadota bacterium]